MSPQNTICYTEEDNFDWSAWLPSQGDLEQMLSVCDGRTSEQTEKALEILKLNGQEIGKAICYALKIRRSDDKKSEYKCLEKINDLTTQLINNWREMRTEHDYMFISMNAHNLENINERTDEDVLKTLDGHIKSLNDAQRILAAYKNEFKKRFQRGRPNELAGLERYFFFMGLLYEQVTENSFTADDYRIDGEPMPITEGQQFLGEALKFLHSNIHKDDKQHYVTYTPSNFQTACIRTSKAIRNYKKK